MKKINNTINKAFILNNISQVEIFSKYFNIAEDVIEDCITSGSLTQSPIRSDERASVGFRYNAKHSLKMRDFGGYFWGDCFDAVAYVLSSKGHILNVSKRQDFMTILRHIAVEFNILDGVKEGDNLKILVNTVKHTKRIITFEPRSWNSIDKRYWIHRYQRLFDTGFLSKHHVYPVERYWIDSYSQPEPKYYHTNSDPCYAYYLGQDDDNFSNIQLYFPHRKKKDKKPKFITNSNSFHGIINIQESYDYIVLTKSNKDVLALTRLFEQFSFTGNHDFLIIGYPSENYVMTEELVDWLLTKLRTPDVGNIFNFVDFDWTGRRCARVAYENYNVPFVFLTNGIFGLDNYEAKDITDFIEKFGVTAAVSLIESFIKYNLNNGEEEDSDGYTGYNSSNAPF